MDRITLGALAKAELHCHLDGSISLDGIRTLAKMAGRSLPEADADLKALVTAPAQTETLLDYLKVFDVIRPLLQTREALAFATYDVARQAAQEQVLYMEIRFAPELSMDKGLTALEAVEAVLDGAERAYQEWGILVKILVCGLKQSNPDVTASLFSEVVSLSERGLAGFDFAGNEADYPTEALTAAIQQAQSLGLPLTFHAGECGCVTNVSQAVALGIKRIGHGTALQGQPEAIAEVVRQEVTIEMCLSSNLQTGAAAHLAAFPYQELTEAGARITINTDNRTVSDTNLTKEYALWERGFGLELQDFYRLNYYAIEASFTSPDEKSQLLQQLQTAYRLAGLVIS